MTEREQQLLAQTLFYKGEEDCPDSIGRCATYWDYERVWVKWELEQDEDYQRLLHWFRTDILKDQPLYPSVPIGLQAIFASRIAHWAGPDDTLSMDAVRHFCNEYIQAYKNTNNQ